MNLVIAEDPAFIRGGLFEGDTLTNSFYLPHASFTPKSLLRNSFSQGLVASENAQFLQSVQEAGMKLHHLKKQDIKIQNKDSLSTLMLSAAYGAFFHFPKNDCLIIDINDKLACHLFAKEGKYEGGALLNLSSNHNAPASPIGATEAELLASGNYYGLLGAIERIVFEMKSAAHSPGSIQIIATGIGTRDPSKAAFLEDLNELVDLISPHLALIGLNQLLKETKPVS